MMVSAQSLQLLHTLLFGFAVAGLLATGYRAATHEAASFAMLERGPKPSTFAAVPFLAFAAPFIIMRVTLEAPRDPHRFYTVMTATIVAGLWSLMSGTVVVMALETLT